MCKKIRFFSIIPIIFTFFFISARLSLPSSISLTKGQSYNLALEPFLNISGSSLPISSGGTALATPTADGIELNTSSPGRYSIGIKMFNILPVKNLEVNVTPEYSVIPSGAPVGIKIFSDGLLIINVANVETPNGVISPAKSAGLLAGDRIVSVNSVCPSTSEELTQILNEAEGDVNLRFLRGDMSHEITVTPAISAEDGSKKLGIWVRDSTAGVGTMTFYDPKTSTFATLGHGITDVDTGDIITPRKGSLCDCDIVSVKQGLPGNPGELAGQFGANTLGEVLMNSTLGVYGKITYPEMLDDVNYMKLATRFEVKTGNAYILTDVGDGTKRYDVVIEDVSKSEQSGNKSLVISVTDTDLLQKTGGIVQGMSGSPIIQNNMLVGALTHVFVNDPTKGYGIFAENMLDEAMKVK